MPQNVLNLRGKEEQSVGRDGFGLLDEGGDEGVMLILGLQDGSSTELCDESPREGQVWRSQTEEQPLPAIQLANEARSSGE